MLNKVLSSGIKQISTGEIKQTFLSLSLKIFLRTEWSLFRAGYAISLQIPHETLYLFSDLSQMYSIT